MTQRLLSSQGQRGIGAKRHKLAALALLLLLGLSRASQDDDAYEDSYYDADNQAQDSLQTIIDQMPDARHFDPIKKNEILKQYKNGGFMVNVVSIEPEGGPVNGNTRVLVRGGPFQDMQIFFPKPKCRFGRMDQVVDAQYVTCKSLPSAYTKEGKSQDRDDYCLQCENAPPVANNQTVLFSVSLVGDFSDSNTSVPFRFFDMPKIHAIEPRWGPKDGKTWVQVWGENFLNFGDNTVCNFGTQSVLAEFHSSSYITCYSPKSDVTEKPIPFSISLNRQQATQDMVDFWFYNNPQVAELEPNQGPVGGGNDVIIKGSNFNPFNFTNGIDISNSTFCNFEGINTRVRAYSLNSTKLRCVAPPSYILDHAIVEVTLNNQQFTDDDAVYWYYKPPEVYDAEPKEGPTVGGTNVTVFGSNFKTDKKIICQFGSIAVEGKIINKNNILCVSPSGSPGYVSLTIYYAGDKYKQYSRKIAYLYYDTPKINKFYPTCGPVTGYTQITVEGENFVNMGFGRAKCIFNNTYHMNATIMETNLIKCDSPILPEASKTALNHGKYTPWFNVSITLNGREIVTAQQHFMYYVDPTIKAVTPNLGPISGGTVSKILGSGFSQEGACNVTVRYGPLTQEPAKDKIQDGEIEVASPQAHVPDAVVVSVSLNGQQFARDYTLHFRDEENTFTYYQPTLITKYAPKSGPVSGKTRIRVSGIGFNQFKKTVGIEKLKIWARFRDFTTGVLIGGSSTLASEVDGEGFSWRTPPAELDTKAILEFSFNNKDWQQVLLEGQSYQFTYYNAPKIISISPPYGPVKDPVQKYVELNGKYFTCPDGDLCQDLWVKFGEDKNAIYVKGERINDDKVRALIPRFTRPDVLHVELTFNGQDYTNDNQTYGFFDPYILRVEPRLISTKGTTRVRLIGFGFVNSGSDLQTILSHTQKGELVCQGGQCLQYATFIDKNTIESPTFPQQTVSIKNDSHNIGLEGMAIDASVLGTAGGQEAFTDNGIEIWYYEGLDLTSLSINGSPKNQVKTLFVATNFKWEVNDHEKFKRYGNFTCRFTSKDGTRSTVTKARMEYYPLGSGLPGAKPTHIRCHTPVWPQAEDAKFDVSVNGLDYQGDFNFAFFEAIDLFRIAPMSGPVEGNTKVKLFGTGFTGNSQQNIHFKWGILPTQPMDKFKLERDIRQLAEVERLSRLLTETPQIPQDYTWAENNFVHQTLEEGTEVLSAYIKETFNVKKVDAELQDGQRLKTYNARAPRLPNADSTHGGPLYMSVGEEISINKTVYKEVTDEATGHVSLQAVTQTDQIYHLGNSKVEYYYYKQPVVKKIEPNAGLVTGGTQIEISGINFAYRPEYGVVPHCKIGKKVVRAQFHSPVRIICISPPNEDITSPQLVQVSLNGFDFVDTGLLFTYYEQPILSNMYPISGPESGGTQIYLTGNRIANMSDPWKFKCRFSSINADIPPKFIPAYFINDTTVLCSSPGGWGRGVSVHVQLTLNGVDYSDNNFQFFYYNIGRHHPRSGPASGKGIKITVDGSGFRNESKIFCVLDKALYLPLNVFTDGIECPVPPAKGGPETHLDVDFSIIIDGIWHNFHDGFTYYHQIEVYDVQPRNGPAEGHGIIQISGRNFRSFKNADVSCKVGSEVGKAIVVSDELMNCTVEEITLVDEDQAHFVTASLNRYSWVDNNETLTFVPYGIISMTPNSGPYTGTTDILISGKGFPEELSAQAKCRFGIPSDYKIVDAVWQSYYSMICRSPFDFQQMPTSSLPLSVPLSISFLDEDFRPWTESIHRFRIYQDPQIISADPDETPVDQVADVYVTAAEGSEFFEPAPLTRGNAGLLGIQCKFGRFGIGHGTYINKTTILCSTPIIQMDPLDIYRESVQLVISMNSQDFEEDSSSVEFTFTGLGSSWGYWPPIILTVLLALLAIAVLMNLVARYSVQAPAQQVSQGPRKSGHVIRDAYEQFTQRAYTSGQRGLRPDSRQPVNFSRAEGRLSNQQYNS